MLGVEPVAALIGQQTTAAGAAVATVGIFAIAATTVSINDRFTVSKSSQNPNHLRERVLILPPDPNRRPEFSITHIVSSCRRGKKNVTPE